MPKGYAYSINNKYNLRLCIDSLNKNKIRYKVYDEYVVCEQRIERFNGSKYYHQYVGEVHVHRFKNEKVTELGREDVEKKCIVGNNCEFRRGRVKYELILPNKKHFYFKRIKKQDWIFDKIFIERSKDFFEFQFGQVYMDNNEQNLEQISCKNDEEQELENSLTNDDNIIYNEDIEFKMVEEVLLKKTCDEPVNLCDYEMQECKETFQVNDVFNDMTKNQAIILGLRLLKVSAKATSLLMKTSPTYILLERGRIEKKIRRLIERRIKYGA